jgi:hypothetical protein
MKPRQPPLTPASASPPTRKGWTLRRCESFDAMRTQSVRDWQRLSATARADAAWELVVTAWNLKRLNPDELRFRRTVTVLRKA